METLEKIYFTFNKYKYSNKEIAKNMKNRKGN